MKKYLQFFMVSAFMCLSSYVLAGDAGVSGNTNVIVISTPNSGFMQAQYDTIVPGSGSERYAGSYYSLSVDHDVFVANGYDGSMKTVPGYSGFDCSVSGNSSFANSAIAIFNSFSSGDAINVSSNASTCTNIVLLRKGRIIINASN